MQGSQSTDQGPNADCGLVLCGPQPPDLQEQPHSKCKFLMQEFLNATELIGARGAVHISIHISHICLCLSVFLHISLCVKYLPVIDIYDQGLMGEMH